MSPLKIIFAGTPDFAAQHLSYIAEHSEHQICAVYTQPDRPKGRGKKLIATPVKAVAQALDIPVFQPLSLKDEDVQQHLAAFNADIMIVVAYGLILPKHVLEAPRLGCINVHASLLPRWRGAAPIERAIEAGDKKTGITLMQMDIGLDDGDMLLHSTIDIDNDDTGDSLRETLAAQGCDILLRGLNQFASDQPPTPTAQDHTQANYAHKLKKQDAQIDWQQSAQTINAKVRAFNSLNVCFSDLLISGQDNQEQQRIKIWQAQIIKKAHEQRAGSIIETHKDAVDVACGENILRLEKIQLAGGKVLAMRDILNSRADWFKVGAQFI